MKTAEDGLQPSAELILVHSSGTPTRLAALRREDKPTGWIFLGRDYLRLLAWQRGLGAGFRRIEIARELEQAARRSRRPFLDLIADLGRRYASLAWWTSRVSERNTMVSPLLLHCCHLQVGLGQLDRIDRLGGPLCVVAESWAVLRSLARGARAKNRRVRWLTPPVPAWRVKLRRYWQMADDACRFLKRRTLASRAARRITGATTQRPVRRDRPCIFLRTFIDEGCLREDGTFLDRHLPGLCAYLEGEGYNVWTIPILFDMKRSYQATWQWLHCNRQQFLNPDEYYRVPDILYILRVALRQVFMPRGRIRLVGLDVTELFDEERLRIAFDRIAMRRILMSRLPRRLRQAGFKLDLLIQGYENMITEKGLIWGLRRDMPETGIVGFQHPVPFPMLLCHFVTAAEARLAPLPDRIICNGRTFRDALVREGLPPQRVVEGPALRYAHLWRNRRPPAAESARSPCVLVALPLELGAAVELLSKVLLALRETNHLPVKIKPHPMMNRDELTRECGAAEMPAHVDFVEGTIAEWLGRSRVVVSTGSAVLYEALAAGIPVVTVGREGGLNLNPLAWLEGLDRVCHDPKEIRAEVLRLWDLCPDELADYRRRGEAVLRTSFNPVTDERMHVFLSTAGTFRG